MCYVIFAVADINECSDASRCSDPNKKCVNLPGTFKCQCKDGYKQLQNGNCEGMHCASV